MTTTAVTLALSPPLPALEVPARAGRTAQPDACFREVLERVGLELDRGERVVGRALSGTHTDAAGMLALQAGIYRYSEAVELTAKFVEQAAAGLRTTLQGSG